MKIDENNREILRMIHDAHRNEISHHRQMQYKVFTWTNSLFLVIMGAVLAFHDKIDDFFYHDILVTIVVLILLASVIVIINQNRRALERNARTVVKVDKVLKLYKKGAYDKNDSIYPEEWLDWGKERKASFETWFYYFASVLMGIITIISCWIVEHQ